MVVTPGAVALLPLPAFAVLAGLPLAVGTERLSSSIQMNDPIWDCISHL
jgi:hypothetical protein